MKTFWGFSLALWLCLPLAGGATQTAQTTLFSRSLRFYQSIDESDSFSLNLSSSPNQNNGESWVLSFIFLVQRRTRRLSGFSGPIFFDHYQGGMDLTVPAAGDANGDGFDDFFQVAQGINATSSGTYSISGLGSGSVTASWSRDAAREPAFAGSPFTTRPTETWLLSWGLMCWYTGPLTYTPGTNTVSGTVDLTQTGDPATTPKPDSVQ